MVSVSPSPCAKGWCPVSLPDDDDEERLLQFNSIAVFRCRRHRESDSEKAKSRKLYHFTCMQGRCVCEENLFKIEKKIELQKWEEEENYAFPFYYNIHFILCKINVDFFKFWNKFHVLQTRSVRRRNIKASQDPNSGWFQNIIWLFSLLESLSSPKLSLIQLQMFTRLLYHLSHGMGEMSLWRGSYGVWEELDNGGNGWGRQDARKEQHTYNQKKWSRYHVALEMVRVWTISVIFVTDLCDFPSD